MEPRVHGAVVSLREYLEKLVAHAEELALKDNAALEQLLSEKINAANKATELAKASADDRMEKSNQVRDQLREQAATFITIKETEARFNNVAADIRELMKSRDLLAGKADQSSVNRAQTLGIIALIISIVLGIASIIMRLLGI
jgi:GTP-dependent phosphoenolpyruvate carboxykinase